MSRPVLQLFGLALAFWALLSWRSGDFIEAWVAGLIAVLALAIGFREKLAPQVLPALRSLSLTALAVAAVNLILPAEQLEPVDSWSVLAWFALGVVGLVVFIRESRGVDNLRGL